MTWEMVKGFITVNIWIIFWVTLIFVAWLIVRQIFLKDAKEYLKSVGMAFVSIVPALWSILKVIYKAIFNWTKIETEEESL